MHMLYCLSPTLMEDDACGPFGKPTHGNGAIIKLDALRDHART